MPFPPRRKESRAKTSLWLGMDFFAWARLLGRNRFAVDLSKLPAALLITAASTLNTLLRWSQTIWYGRRIRAIDPPDDLIFIIGHWRTGTTMLHELMALDSRHRCPSTYESLLPNHFLLSERFVRRFARFLLPRTRPFDNMRMSFDRPQEDEAALALRGQPSTFLTAAFPRRPLQDSNYVDLEELSPKQLRAWKTRLLDYLKILLFREGGRLVLKSPQHTFRLPTLNEAFPRARFIHIVRDPYDVFPSTVHFWQTMYDSYGLQRFDMETLREQVFSTFARMHDRLQSTRGLIDAERFYELRYEELVADPVGQLEAVYEHFELGEFDRVRPAMEQYAQRSSRYRTNHYELDDATRSEISRRWAAFIETYDYQSSGANC